MADYTAYTGPRKTTKLNGEDLVIQQRADGVEETKSIKQSLLLASELNKSTFTDSLGLTGRYQSLLMNPLRSQGVVANASNLKAYSVPTKLSVNEAVGLNLSGAKSSTTKVSTGNLANSITFNVAFQHRVPSVETARVICNLMEKADLSIAKPLMTLTNNSLVIKGWATVADADVTTGVTLSTRTLVVGKTYNYSLVYGGTTGTNLGTVKLYENGTMIYSNTITYHSEYVASILAGVALQPALEEVWLAKAIYNYALSDYDVRQFCWNNGHPESAVLHSYMKWVSSDNIVPVNASQFTEQAGVDWWNITVGLKALNSGFMRVTETGETSDAPGFTKGNILIIGKRYRISFKMKSSAIRVPSLSSFHWRDISIILGGATEANGDWKNFIFEATSKNTIFRAYLHTSYGSLNITDDIDDIEITQLGAVASFTSKGINIPETMTADTGTTAELTAMTEGLPYEITTAGTTTWSTYGSTSSVVGTRFIANQTVATIPNSGKVRLVAVTKEANIGWYDESTNLLHATVAGNPIIETVQAEEVFGDGAISSVVMSKYLDASAGANVGDTLFLPPKWMVTECILYNYGTDSVTVKIGSTSGGGEYVSTKVLTAGQLVKFSVPDTLDPYSLTAFSPFYLSSASWGSGKVKAEFCMKKTQNTW